ncbi:hypothetical protein ACFDTO_12545 [Microbacteriaceae bacterium 4G12]
MEKQYEQEDLPIAEPKAYENVKQIVIVGVASFVSISVYGFITAFL